MRRLRATLRLLPAICLPLLLAVGGASRAAAGSTSHSLVNRPAPAFTLKDFEGQTIQLSQYRGKVILLNFWASWCGPCQVEMPEFAKWQSSFGGRLEVLGISMDDNIAQAKAAARRLHVNYPLLAGNQEVGEAYGGIFGLPETFLIDPNGKIRAVYQGGNHLEEIHARIERLIPHSND